VKAFRTAAEATFSHFLHVIDDDIDLDNGDLPPRFDRTLFQRRKMASMH
jgi:hypothetical protein